MKQSPSPMFNWELPGVEMPDEDGTHPVLTAEQWVVWFRTLPTYSQILVAKSILELEEGVSQVTIADIRHEPAPSDHTVESLRAALRGIKAGLRSALEDTKGMKPQKKRAALLTERMVAIGVAIKGMGL